MKVKQDCLHYDYQVRNEIVGVDFDGNPEWDVIDEQEICYKLDKEPNCEVCEFYKKRIVDETPISELPF